MPHADNKTIDQFRKTSEKIDELFLNCEKEEGTKLLMQVLADAKEKDDAYALFFEGEIQGYLHEDYLQQQDLFKKAIELRKEDYFLTRNLGVSLSNKGDEDGAISLYDKALKLNPKDHNSLINKGVSLSKKGDEDGAIALYDEALKLNPKDCYSLCQKGVSLSKKGEEVKAIELFDRALKINPNDFNLYRDKGVALLKKGEEDKAIEYFNKALDLNPKDYNSWREKGVSLSKKRDYVGAIALFNKALELNPKDYNSFRSKGVNLSNLGDYSGANKIYEEALKIKPNDAETYYCKSILEYNSGHFEKSILFVEKGLEINPKHFLLNRFALFLNERFKGNKFLTPKIGGIVKETPKLTEDQPVNITQGIVANVQDLTSSVFEGFLKKMKDKQKHLDGFIEDGRKGRADGAWFHILRKWNSYTPILPTDGAERSVGGGYFLQSFGKGIVIDPGFGFIENFCKAGFRIDDIDAVVVTHAHNDHNSDLESLFTLFYKHNEHLEGKKEDKKKIDLYLNTGAFLKFSGMLNIRSSNYIGTVYTLMPDHEYIFDKKTKLKALKAYHDEVITKDCAVGLWFEIFNNENDKKNIIISSDTSLYPPLVGSDGVDVDQEKEIWKTYGIGENKINLLVPHLGSIRESEFTKEYKDAKEMFYKNHLGILGSTVLISRIKPDLAVMSEFGEELSEIQEKLVNLIGKVVLATTKNEVKFLPGDTGFIYDILSGKVCCQCSGEMLPLNEISYDVRSDGHFYYYKFNIPPAKFEEKLNEWKEKRKKGELCCHKQNNETQK